MIILKDTGKRILMLIAGKSKLCNKYIKHKNIAISKNLNCAKHSQFLAMFSFSLINYVSFIIVIEIAFFKLRFFYNCNMLNFNSF